MSQVPGCHCRGRTAAAMVAAAAVDAAPLQAPPQQSAGKHQAAEGAYSGLLDGLRLAPKQLPCSYLYDAAGSELYERITELEEYYPFRTEQAMLKQHAREIASYITPGARSWQVNRLHRRRLPSSRGANCACSARRARCASGTAHRNRSTS